MKELKSPKIPHCRNNSDKTDRRADRVETEFREISILQNELVAILRRL
jgi:hypothetical protein